MDSQKLMNRFLKSRVLPILTILILFSGWVLIAWYFLWQVRVKEEFRSVGRLIFYSNQGNASSESKEERMKLILLNGMNHAYLSSLSPGQEILLSVEVERGQEALLHASLIQIEKEEPGEGPVLILRRRDSGKEKDWSSRIHPSQPVKMNLVVRGKRLISVALKKNQLLQ